MMYAWVLQIHCTSLVFRLRMGFLNPAKILMIMNLTKELFSGCVTLFSLVTGVPVKIGLNVLFCFICKFKG